MKIFAIREETDKSRKNLAYLFYYENSKCFYIELSNNADPWETPLPLSVFVRRGELSVNSHWSMLWVRQRIVPTDRQNIGQILRDNKLKEYDEYELLMLSSGRCEQDDYYLVQINENRLPNEIALRLNMRLEDVVPLENFSLLLFFRNDMVRRCDLNEYFSKTPKFQILTKHPDYFRNVLMQPGGYGVQWDGNLSISYTKLYEMGEPIPLTAGDFKAYASQRIINAADAAEILNCSRQYINELVKKKQLHPIKASGKNTLFLKSEVLQRSWQ